MADVLQDEYNKLEQKTKIYVDKLNKRVIDALSATNDEEVI
jgi:hypothetical protein